MGCGACATVCPSGAMSYQFPRVARPRRAAEARCSPPTARPAAATPAFSFTTAPMAATCSRGGRGRGRGLPARVLPLETWHVASDRASTCCCGAIALGANQVAVLCAGSEDAGILAVAARADGLGQSILAGLGYAGAPFRADRGGDARGRRRAFAALAPAAGPGDAGDLPPLATTSAPRSNSRSSTWRSTRRAASTRSRSRAGAPFGEVASTRPKCTHVPRLRRRLPRVRADGRRRRAAAQASSSATACSAACANAPAPRRRSRSRRGCCSRPAAREAARAQRDAAVPLRVLRQALRHEADGRRDDGPARRPFDVLRRRGPASACRCAPTAASST